MRSIYSFPQTVIQLFLIHKYALIKWCVWIFHNSHHILISLKFSIATLPKATIDSAIFQMFANVYRVIVRERGQQATDVCRPSKRSFNSANFLLADSRQAHLSRKVFDLRLQLIILFTSTRGTRAPCYKDLLKDKTI